MKYTLRFLPEVEEDAFDSYAWYEAKVRGLGEEFLRILYACSAELTRNPLLYPKVYHEFRRCLLRRFPHAIYYRVEGDKIFVFGVFHCAREPGAIKTRLLNRSIP